MNICAGIDIAKLILFAATFSFNGKVIIEPFKFTNDADGLQLLVSILNKLIFLPYSFLVLIATSTSYLLVY